MAALERRASNGRPGVSSQRDRFPGRKATAPKQPSRVGIARRRRGRGFGYLYLGGDRHGDPVEDAETIDRVLRLARRLPRLRSAVAEGLDASVVGRERVLAASVRMLDIGVFRSGSSAYVVLHDPQLLSVVRSLRRARADGELLLAYRSGGGWHEISAGELNDYLKELVGEEYTAKDLRTWNATVMGQVSELLGNTPAVARASYVDPRVV